MKTVGEILKLSSEFLKSKQDPQARLHAEYLMSHLLKLPRLDLYMQFDRPLEEKEITLYRELLKRKAQGEPLEYLLGELLFYGCTLSVTPDVLIPRPETEILLDKVVARLKEDPLKRREAWDLCCGSGCLGIGLKKTFPDFSVVLSDLSPKALDLARKNAEKNGLKVECLLGNFLAPFQGRKADLVLCNPPYISQKEYEALDPSVRLHEPRMALVAGERGEEFYERLAQEIPVYLNAGALLCLEIGYNQGKKVEALFSAPCWRAKALEKDWAGHDRFFFLEFE